MGSISTTRTHSSAAQLPASIKVEYRLEPEDHGAWWLRAWERSLARPNRGLAYWYDRFAKPLAVVVMVLLACEFAALSLALAEKPNLLDWPFAGGAVLILLLLALTLRGIGPYSFARKWSRIVALRRIRRLAERTSVQHQQVVLSLSPSLVTEIIEVHLVEQGIEVHERKEASLDWSRFASIDLAGQHVFFITDNNLAAIVPQRAFADEKAFLEFVETAWAFHRRAKEQCSSAESTDAFSSQRDRVEARITARGDDRIQS